MKRLIGLSAAVLAALVLYGGICHARSQYPFYNRQPMYPPRQYSDFWGHRYRQYDNLWKDLDRDGVSGYWDYNDRDPNIWHPSQKNWWR